MIRAAMRHGLFCANFLVGLVGLVYMGLAIGLQLQIKGIVDWADINVQVVPIVSIVVGATVFFITFLGCYGTIKGHRYILISTCVIMLMVITLTLAILTYVNIYDIVGQIPRWLNEAFASDPIGFQDFEITFECCSPNGWLSYRPDPLPDSCCVIPPCTHDNVYRICNVTVQDFFDKFGHIIGGIALFLAAVELVSVVFALYLSSQGRSGRKDKVFDRFY